MSKYVAKLNGTVDGEAWIYTLDVEAVSLIDAKPLLQKKLGDLMILHEYTEFDGTVDVYEWQLVPIVEDKTYTLIIERTETLSTEL